MAAEIEDTYAEAFSGVYSGFLVTAKNEDWLMHAVNAAIGCATSGIGCGCEAGIDGIVSPQKTPDGRIGAIVQFYVGSGSQTSIDRLEHELIHRIGQCILTAPTTAVWNITDSENTFKIGYKMGFFADGFQKEEQRFGRTVINIPRMMGEFLIEKEIGYAKGILGGNLWFFGVSEDSALDAAQRAVDVIRETPGVIASFPGGICASGSKIGSKYKFLTASTNERLCPTLRSVVEDSQVPADVGSISEVVFNAVSTHVMKEALLHVVSECKDLSGLVKISAGNYGGKLGKYHLHLRKERWDE